MDLLFIIMSFTASTVPVIRSVLIVIDGVAGCRNRFVGLMVSLVQRIIS
ncbi:hypothetical protein KY335_02140 [Candidatus Woesearchaeota archaeon]|nr:hypothetical protein [Candidatus Woesearchaeota archaeon]